MADWDASYTIETVSWTCVAICGLAIAGRSIIKASKIRHVGADDFFIWAGFLFFVGQCVAVQVQAENGLGQHISQVTPAMREGELKAEYANYLLYMPILARAKLSVVSVLRKCALQKKDRRLLYLFEWFLAAWAISSEFVRAFECNIPVVWDYVHGSCINRQAWVVYFELINILTDLALIILPTLNISRIQTSWDKKLMAIAFFSARIVVIPAEITRIVYWLKGSTTQDVTYDLYPFAICSVAVAALEILTACVLYMRPLFEILETGFSLRPPLSPLRADSPKFGPYSRGTWPFTRLSSFDEYLTHRGAGYEAKVQAGFYIEEKSPTGSEDHIHISKRVDIQMSYPPIARKMQFNRAQIPSMSTNPSVSDSSPSLDKTLPSTPTIERGTFLSA